MDTPVYPQGADQMVYHYYHKKYSETGIISDDLDKVLAILARDFVDGKDSQAMVRDALEKVGRFDEYHVRIVKTHIQGDVNDFYGYLFVLRHPLGLYVDEKLAWKEALQDKLSEEELEKAEQEYELESLFYKHCYYNNVEMVEPVSVDVSFLK